MFTYVPSLTLLLVSIFTIGVLFAVRLPLVAIVIIAVALLAITTSHHFSLYTLDYKQTSWTQVLTSYAPFILIGSVILMALAYIFMLSRPTGSYYQTPGVSQIVNSTYGALGQYANKGYNAIRNNLGYNRSTNRNEFISALNRAI